MLVAQALRYRFTTQSSKSISAQFQISLNTYQLSDPRVAELLHLAEALLADVARGVYECTRYALAVPAPDAERPTD